MSWPRQAFALSAELIDSITEEEVEATFKDMEELNLARDPFEEYDILVPEWKVISVIGPDGEVDYRQAEANKARGYIVRMRFVAGQEPLFLMQNKRKEFKPIEEILDWTYTEAAPSASELQRDPLMSDKGAWLKKYHDSSALVMANFRRALIVLLATKNIVKEVKECKTLKLGIGSKERNRYTTTLKVGEVTERTTPSEEHEAAGLLRRPHLRRGHIRRQHHGPRNEFVKSIWIEPVFVNADPKWISERTAYNVSMAGPKAKEKADA